jgi:sugar phosphate isomerase/epimerase
MTNAVYLNGATIMTTPTGRHLEIARETGYDGVEVRAERLLEAPNELADAARVVRQGEVWSLNGIQLQLRPDGSLDRTRLEAELPPRLEVCRRMRAEYLLVVPPRVGGGRRS